MKKELELYIHIPFCVKKCAYCDFLSAPAKKEERESYVRALIKEIDHYKKLSEFYTISTIFIGGGTPSLLEAEQIVRILNKINETFTVAKNAEISMEMNPGTLKPGALQGYREAGVNRVSFGLQSANEKELKLLGRIHTWEDFQEAYEEARSVGFDNINVDLISSIPGQTLSSWEETLKKVAELSPEHISAYSLIIEEGTPFYERYGEGKEGEKDLPEEETERAIYKGTKEILSEFGYERYEISNYAREGYACRHNLGYWERKEYLGFGIGAASLMEEVRWSNIRDIETYIKNAENGCIEANQEAREVLTLQERIEEFLFLGLRKMEGISLEEYEDTFGKSIFDDYEKVIRKLEKENLIKVEKDRMFLMEKGIDVSNYVFVEFMSSNNG